MTTPEPAMPAQAESDPPVAAVNCGPARTGTPVPVTPDRTLEEILASFDAANTAAAHTAPAAAVPRPPLAGLLPPARPPAA